MKFHSLNDPKLQTSFREAVIAGIAPDRGLYFPQNIKALPKDFFENIESLSPQQIAFAAIHQFVGGDIPDGALRDILAKTLDFGFPLVELQDDVAVLELFHGPTMAFKDVGARFMANSLGYFSQGEKQEVTVLVATSGDTGGAVANGFLGVPGVKVVILYPSGKVSEIQEKQLTTLGSNIEAMEVQGSFDDCQEMVKTAFLDPQITARRKLTSANSINVARWLPQMFYFLFAYARAKEKGREIVFSVPSGNFGNLCAGMLAQRLGMPVKHFIAATNVNDVVPRFLGDGNYSPLPSKATISNAMDVGDPSNFVRIRRLYRDDLPTLRANLSSHSFTDALTREAIREVYEKTSYVMDPHGAVGYLGLREHQKSHPGTYGIFLETAHPVKFLDVVEGTLGLELPIPPQIQKVMGGQKKSIPIAGYGDLREYLLGQ